MFVEMEILLKLSIVQVCDSVPGTTNNLGDFFFFYII